MASVHTRHLTGRHFPKDRVWIFLLLAYRLARREKTKKEEKGRIAGHGHQAVKAYTGENFLMGPHIT